MRAVQTDLAEVFVLEPRVFGDERGYFFESYNAARFAETTGRDVRFVQDNQSRSAQGVLRGLHYQIEQPQGKLIRVLAGEIFDVAVDLRKSSATFGRWVGVVLSGANRRQVWVPEGFAHGFYVLSDFAEVMYKTSDFYAPQHERCLAWNDPEIGIDWPLRGEPVLSPKDSEAALLAAAEVFP